MTSSAASRPRSSWSGGAVAQITDLEGPGVVVLDDLQVGIVDLHLIGRNHADDGEPSAGQGRKSTFDPSTAPVGETVLALPVATLGTPRLGQAVGDHGVQGDDAAMRASQPRAPRTVAVLGPVGILRIPSAIGLRHGSDLSAVAAQRPVPRSRVGPTAGGCTHSRTHRRPCHRSTQVAQSSALDALASSTSAGSPLRTVSRIPQIGPGSPSSNDGRPVVLERKQVVARPAVLPDQGG